ncbi:uncharacterized protein DNG_10317 [Cephalotrichum gorgonifer]|uniref:Uncharacterized protein n=1 Tax=Cephalotrichum gorgonifer TaxID=2041049 RepID=A0AAE8T0L5_9PEZI|nr:uncharacterized protein DNG_10317 [Cephalotrichum gorgonifer]
MDSTEDVPVADKMDRSSELFLVQTVFVVIAGVCLLVRGYIKCFIIKINSLDDYLLYGAMLVYVAYSGVVIDGCLNGATGRHPSLDISLEKAAHSLRSWYICMVLYPAITLAIRSSVCVLLFRLNSKRSYLWIIWINLVVTTIASIAFFFILVFQCSPPQYFWRQLYGDNGYCHEKLIVTYSAIVFIMSWLSLLLISLGIPGNLGAAQAAKKPDLPPTTLEVDLVFPRANETHQRTWPFPIVFAIHGAKSLWPYHLLFKWDLENIERTENNTRGDTVGDRGDFEDVGLSTRYTNGELPGDEDIFYYIASTDVIGEYRNTDFYIKWEAVLPANCSKGDEVPLTWQEEDEPVFYAPRGFGPAIKGFALFQVSDDAPMDITLDSCLSLEDTSFNNEERNTLRIGGTVTDSQCIFYDEENFRPEPNPCAVKADSALASRVTETMLARSGCKDVSWPDEVDGPCPIEKEDEPSGAEGRLVTRGVIILAGMLLGALQISSILG